jgi:hypothetical protein
MKFSEPIAHLAVALRDPVSDFIEIAGELRQDAGELEAGECLRRADSAHCLIVFPV